MSQFTAHLVKDPPFYGLFEHGIVPIKAPIAGMAALEGQHTQECYFLDPTALTTAQTDALAAKVAEVFRADLEEVRAELKARGLPIRASQVSAVALPLRFLL